MKDQALYTLVVSGAAFVELRSPKNPVLTHRGGTSAGHMVLSKAEVSTIQEQAKAAGLNLTVTPMLGQTEEQRAEREVLTSWRDRVWPCASCLTCAWLDVQEDEACGLVVWPKETVRAFLETQPSYAAARAACPLGRGRHIP